MTLYLDASVIVPLFIVEPGTTLIGTLLSRPLEVPLVGDFAAGEVTSALARRVRIGELTVDDANLALSLLDSWRQTRCQTPEFDSADIRLPDAIHAAASQRLGATLVTFDHRLADAATALGIDALIPA